MYVCIYVHTYVYVYICMYINFVDFVVTLLSMKIAFLKTQNLCKLKLVNTQKLFGSVNVLLVCEIYFFIKCHLSHYQYWDFN